VTVTARVVPDSEGAGASLRDVLAAALDANREMARLAAVLREENARLRAQEYPMSNFAIPRRRARG
jgi:hypothetical protein